MKYKKGMVLRTRMHAHAHRPGSAIAVLLVFVSLALAGCMHEQDGDGNGDGDGPATTTRVIFADHAEHGSILVDADGMTLYIFTNDEPGQSNCFDSCAENWPPLIADELPEAPPELQARLSLIDREGEQQVAHDDRPLYYFVQDMQAGDANGEGLNDVWFVVREDAGEEESTEQEEEEQEEEDEVQVVEIQSGQADGYDPTEITVTAGTTVRWLNVDDLTHTSTADDGSWDSGSLSPDDEFEFTFDEPGEYAYHCEIHAPQEGVVIVE